MNIRVTAQTQTASAIANMQRQTAAIARYQSELSSGWRVQLPSDDPAAYPALVRARTTSTRYAAYDQTISESTGTLNSGVTALGDVNNVLVRAKQIAIEGADASTTADGLAALANEVDGLINRALSAGNTQVDDQYLFGGTATGAPPFRVATFDANGKPATIAYDGAAERARTVIGPGQTVDTRYAGTEVLQNASGDVFQALIGLRDDLRNPANAKGGSAIFNQRLGEIDKARDVISNVTGEQASSLATLQAIQARMSDLKLSADTRVGDLAATDFAETIVKMQEQSTGLQATLSVSSKLLQPSLLDFIR